jgi:hypothetical protein
MEETAQFFQFKMYFFMKLSPFMSNSELDRVLNAIYKKVMSKDEDQALKFQKYNVNPLRNNMQILHTLATLGALNGRGSEKVNNATNALNEKMTEYMRDPMLIAKKIKMQSL